MDERIYPAEPVYDEQMREAGDAALPPADHGGAQGGGARARPVEPLPSRPDEHGAGPDQRSSTRRWPRSWAARSISRRRRCNCSAPDTGNMEVLHAVRHRRAQGALAAPAARRRDPLGLRDDRAGRRLLRRDQHRDCGSSATATSTCSTAASGGRRTRCTRNCRVLIVMGKTDPDGPPHQQQSMVLVPLDTPGVDDRARPAGLRLPGPRGPRRGALRRTCACPVEHAARRRGRRAS